MYDCSLHPLVDAFILAVVSIVNRDKLRLQFIQDLYIVNFLCKYLRYRSIINEVQFELITIEKIHVAILAFLEYNNFEKNTNIYIVP